MEIQETKIGNFILYDTDPLRDSLLKQIKEFFERHPEEITFEILEEKGISGIAVNGAESLEGLTSEGVETSDSELIEWDIVYITDLAYIIEEILQYLD